MRAFAIIVLFGAIFFQANEIYGNNILEAEIDGNQKFNFKKSLNVYTGVGSEVSGVLGGVVGEVVGGVADGVVNGVIDGVKANGGVRENGVKGGGGVDSGGVKGNRVKGGGGIGGGAVKGNRVKGGGGGVKSNGAKGGSSVGGGARTKINFKTIITLSYLIPGSKKQHQYAFDIVGDSLTGLHKNPSFQLMLSNEQFLLQETYNGSISDIQKEYLVDVYPTDSSIFHLSSSQLQELTNNIIKHLPQKPHTKYLVNLHFAESERISNAKPDSPKYKVAITVKYQIPVSNKIGEHFFEVVTDGKKILQDLPAYKKKVKIMQDKFKDIYYGEFSDIKKEWLIVLSQGERTTYSAEIIDFIHQAKLHLSNDPSNSVKLVIKEKPNYKIIVTLKYKLFDSNNGWEYSFETDDEEPFANSLALRQKLNEVKRFTTYQGQIGHIERECYLDIQPLSTNSKFKYIKLEELLNQIKIQAPKQTVTKFIVKLHSNQQPQLTYKVNVTIKFSAHGSNEENIYSFEMVTDSKLSFKDNAIFRTQIDNTKNFINDIYKGTQPKIEKLYIIEVAPVDENKILSFDETQNIIAKIKQQIPANLKEKVDIRIVNNNQHQSDSYVPSRPSYKIVITLIYRIPGSYEDNVHTFEIVTHGSELPENNPVFNMELNRIRNILKEQYNGNVLDIKKAYTINVELLEPNYDHLALYRKEIHQMVDKLLEETASKSNTEVKITYNGFTLDIPNVHYPDQTTEISVNDYKPNEPKYKVKITLKYKVPGSYQEEFDIFEIVTDGKENPRNNPYFMQHVIKINEIFKKKYYGPIEGIQQEYTLDFYPINDNTEMNDDEIKKFAYMLAHNTPIQSKTPFKIKIHTKKSEISKPHTPNNLYGIRISLRFYNPNNQATDVRYIDIPTDASHRYDTAGIVKEITKVKKTIHELYGVSASGLIKDINVYLIEGDKIHQVDEAGVDEKLKIIKTLVDNEISKPLTPYSQYYQLINKTTKISKPYQYEVRIPLTFYNPKTQDTDERYVEIPTDASYHYDTAEIVKEINNEKSIHELYGVSALELIKDINVYLIEGDKIHQADEADVDEKLKIVKHLLDKEFTSKKLNIFITIKYIISKSNNVFKDVFEVEIDEKKLASNMADIIQKINYRKNDIKKQYGAEIQIKYLIKTEYLSELTQLEHDTINKAISEIRQLPNNMINTSTSGGKNQGGNDSTTIKIFAQFHIKGVNRTFEESLVLNNFINLSKEEIDRRIIEMKESFEHKYAIPNGKTEVAYTIEIQPNNYISEKVLPIYREKLSEVRQLISGQAVGAKTVEFNLNVIEHRSK